MRREKMLRLSVWLALGERAINSWFRWVVIGAVVVLVGAGTIAGLAPADASSRPALDFERVGSQDASMRPWSVEVGAVENLEPMIIRVPRKTYDKIIEALNADARLPNDIPTPPGTFLVRERCPLNGRVWHLHPQGTHEIASIIRAAYVSRKLNAPDLSHMEAGLDAPQQSAR
jgi:hypothetical protein